jgi:hypothetical protein
MQFLDKLGWPVETLKGRPVSNFFRRVIHTRKIKRGNFKYQPRKNSSVLSDCDGEEIRELQLLSDPICSKHHG